MAKPADKVSADFGRNPGACILISNGNSGAGTSFGPWLCRSPCQYGLYGLRLASRPEPKSWQRSARFVML